MGYPPEGRDAGNQKHITTDAVVYNGDERLSLLGSPQEECKLKLNDLQSSDNAANLQNILPNVAIYSDGRKRTWETKNGAVSKIVHADGQVWTRKDNKHWNISYHGKLIGKNVEMTNVKIDDEKNLSWTIGGVKKTLSATGNFYDPELAAKAKLHEHHVKLDHKVDHAVQPSTEHQTFARTVDFERVGPASWYGPGFHGGHTASGDVFDQNKLTAAHRTLPFGTKLLVTDTETGKTVIVTVTDRGPFHGKRVLDLSKGAARKLDMIRKGVIEVGYKIL